MRLAAGRGASEASFAGAGGGEGAGPSLRPSARPKSAVPATPRARNSAGRTSRLLIGGSFRESGLRSEFPETEHALRRACDGEIAGGGEGGAPDAGGAETMK